MKDLRYLSIAAFEPRQLRPASGSTQARRESLLRSGKLPRPRRPRKILCAAPLSIAVFAPLQLHSATGELPRPRGPQYILYTSRLGIRAPVDTPVDCPLSNLLSNPRSNPLSIAVFAPRQLRPASGSTQALRESPRGGKGKRRAPSRMGGEGRGVVASASQPVFLDSEFRVSGLGFWA